MFNDAVKVGVRPPNSIVKLNDAMDMMYNMGQTRFDYIITYGKDGKPRGYPKFWDAVANRDLVSMIKESAREGLAKRNKEIQNMLLRLEKVRY